MSGTVRLPGGVRITFHGYLPDRRCDQCGVTYPAGAFLERPKVIDGRRRANFVGVCLSCRGPHVAWVNDLRGLRVTSTYTDAMSRAIGWRERDRNGVYGPALPLETMSFRVVATTVRPQPRLNRHKAGRLVRAPQPVRTTQRSFTRPQVRSAAQAQDWMCTWCGGPLAQSLVDVHGDHIVPVARGGASVRANCQALHATCNVAKGTRRHRGHRKERTLWD